jgi:hypothetical protein
LCFFTKLGPQVSLFPVPIFGVNIFPFNYGIKSDFIPELTINAQRLRAKSIQQPFFPPPTVGIFAQTQTLVHQTFELKSSNGRPRPGSLGKSHPPKAHLVLPSSNSISDFSFCL